LPASFFLIRRVISLFSVMNEIKEGLIQLEDTRRQSHIMKQFDGKFSPTEASLVTFEGNVLGTCARKTFFNKKSIDKEDFDKYMPDVIEKHGLKMMLIHEFGRQFEQVNFNALTKLGHDVVCNGKYKFNIYNTKYYMSYEFDHLLNLKGTNKVIGIEEKSGNGWNFTMQRVMGRKKANTIKEKDSYTLNPSAIAPDPSHLLQASIYLYDFITNPTNKDFELDSWRILYVTRDSMEMREFAILLENVGNLHYPKIFYLEDNNWVNVPIIPICVEDVLDRFVKIGNSIDSNIVPACDYMPFLTNEDLDNYQAAGLLSDSKLKNMRSGKEDPCDWQCNYCKWHEICKVLPNHEFDFSNLTKEKVLSVVQNTEALIEVCD